MDIKINQSANPADPAQRVARDEAKERAPNPRRHYKSPELLMADATLSDADKLSLLQEWDLDLNNRLGAEEEGMSAQDPIRGDREAVLAEESARVRTFIAQLRGPDSGAK